MRKLMSFLAVLTLLVPLAYAQESISIRMDLFKTLSQAMDEGKYGVAPGVNRAFSSPVGNGSKTVDILVVAYETRMDSNAILADMGKHDLRPATFQELVWMGMQDRSAQRHFPVVALGTVAKLYGWNHVACLYRGPGRYLGLMGFNSGLWTEGFRFAAVRK